MCTKILTILLIPILVLGNSFAHTSCCVAHSSDDNNRTHFHIGIGSSHDHDDHKQGHCHDSHLHSQGDQHHQHHHDGDGQTSEPFEHDSDAIYLVVPDGKFSAPSSISIDFKSVAVFGHVSECFSKKRIFLNCNREIFYRADGPPLYLLHCAIRI